MRIKGEYCCARRTSSTAKLFEIILSGNTATSRPGSCSMTATRVKSRDTAPTRPALVAKTRTPSYAMLSPTRCSPSTHPGTAVSHQEDGGEEGERLPGNVATRTMGDDGSEGCCKRYEETEVMSEA